MALRYLWPRASAGEPSGHRSMGPWSEAAETIEAIKRFVLRLLDGGPPTKVTLASQPGERSALDARAASAPGDLPSFEAFFREHQRAIFSYLYRMTGDEQAAYDLSQETFVRAWQRFDRIRGYEQPAAWLFRVATNLALNDRRGRASPVRATLSLDADMDPAGSDPSWRFAERDAIREALLAMPPRQRAALVLREVYGLSGEDVAATLGISSGAAKMLLSRAREQFRVQYRGKDEPR
jgi:RNA polymerase sigma-70 factor, ECF subfamily